MDKKITWKNLKEFIDNKIEKEGDSWLESELYIEAQGTEELNSSFSTIQCSEKWTYIKPAWEHGVLTTTFKNKKIITLNINY